MNRRPDRIPSSPFTGIAALGLFAAALAAGLAVAEQQPAKAMFAGGCFWCMEPPFEKLAGVASVTSGYAGGPEKDPSYEQVSSGATGHAEVVQIVYDPTVVSYDKLLEVYWRNVDPTTSDRQFCDTGSQYRPIIFYGDDAEKHAAEQSKKKLQESKRFSAPIAVEIRHMDEFWPAEEYHQDFYKKNADHYRRYRVGCGRDRRLAELWGD